MPAVVACWLASATSIVVMAWHGASVAWAVAWFTSTAAAVAATARLDAVASRLPGGRVIGPSDLDDPCRELLCRAQAAIETVLGSPAHAADPLLRAAGEEALRRQEWDIAVTLRDITALRAESEAALSMVVGAGEAGAVLDSHRRALTLAQDSSASRVHALERYAAQVRAAEAAQAEWDNAVKLAGLNSRYLDLLARTAADEHAVAEIAGLARQASAAAAAFRDGVQRAISAVGPLAIPGDDETHRASQAPPTGDGA